MMITEGGQSRSERGNSYEKRFLSIALAAALTVSGTAGMTVIPDMSVLAEEKEEMQFKYRIAGGWDTNLPQKSADVNKDGAVNLKDVLLLRRYITGGWNVTLK